MMNPQALLELLVNQDSPTSDVEGVNRVQRLVEAQLRGLGFKTNFIANPDPNINSGYLLVAELEGERSEFITLVGHADTVLPLSETGRFNVSLSGRATGSGVIDNKGGLVVAIEGLRQYLENGHCPELSLRFVISPNEEAGSLGFHELFKKYARDAVLVLGFEPALENGSIVCSRRGNRWYQLEIEGREAHAGRCRGEELNAAVELAHKIVKLSSLSDPTAGTSVQVGQLSGGRDRFNVVCGQASAKIDVRFASFAAREALHSEIREIFAHSFVRSAIQADATRSRYDIVDDCPPFSNDGPSDSILDFLVDKVALIENRPIKAERAGGAGDVNYMARAGLAVIDGLGPVGGRMHTPEEFVDLSTLSTRATVFAQALVQAPKLLDLPTLHSVAEISDINRYASTFANSDHDSPLSTSRPAARGSVQGHSR